MKQKIIKIGNSQGIILSKEVLDQVKMDPSQEVYIIPDPNSGAIIIADKAVSPYNLHRAKFNKIIDELNEEYKDDLQELAGK